MRNVRGIGIDLCAIGRMRPCLTNERFLAQCLTAEERDYLSGRGEQAAASLAGLWAAKEAALKALGVGLSVPLRDVGVTHEEGGRPRYCLTGRAAELAQGGELLLSITHEGDMAAAFCVWQAGK